jgi:cell wall assembly regulator SMI1
MIKEGVEKILSDLFKKSLTQVGNNYFTPQQVQENWIGNPAATTSEVQETELRLGIQLPEDYKEFLSIANGYPTHNDAVEPSFLEVGQIQYLKTYDHEIVEIWKGTGNDETGAILEQSIIIAGMNEEQYFLLIPPNNTTTVWRYWKFASWIPGEIEYKNLTDYFLDVISSIDSM